MLPLRRRVLPVLGVLIGAPITAEYLFAYLPFTGDLWMSLIAIVFFAPLYGGVALLIREVAVRTGRGWTAVLLMAAAFGVTMPGLIDLAMLGEDRADVAFWAQLREPTLIPALGISGFPMLSWTLGHVIMSIGAPLALLEALAPAHRGRPLLGRIGIPVTILAAALAVLMVHQDGRETYGYAPSWIQTVSVLAVAAAITATAFTRVGVPLEATRAVRGASAGVVLVGAASFKAVTDVLPPTWLGAAFLVSIVIASGTALRWCARHLRWGAREIGTLGAGVVIAGALTGFVTPLPEGVALPAKIAHSSVLLALALVVLLLVLRRTAPRTR